MAESSPILDLDSGFALDGVTVRPRNLQIVRDGQEIKLEPKVMAILLELARRPGEVISRNEFADTVWRGRVVSDEVLSHNVSVLRSALGDDARAPRFIQTVPTVGYRLVAGLSPLEGAGSGARRPRLLPAVIAVLAAVIVGLSAWWMGMPATDPTLPETTVAVLPFQNLSDDQSTEYFSDGLTDEVMGSLAGVDGLFVVARTSSFLFRNRSEDVRAIGARLGAGSIIEGSARKSGNRLRVSANLVNANNGIQLWSETFDAELEDVFEIQNRIAKSIVGRLVGTLSPEVTLSQRDTSNLEAFELYLRANHQLYHRGPAAVGRSIDLYEEAISLDPGFARAHVGLAQAHAMMPTYLNELEMPYLAKARASLDRAEALGHTSARLLGTRAYVSFREWRWAEAHDYFERALTMTPTDSDVRQQYSQFLGTVGRMQEALDQALAAVEADPLSGVAHQRLAVVYLWVDDLEQARHHMAMADELGLDELATPEAFIALLARAGDFAAANEELRRVQNQRGQLDDWIDPVLAAVRGQGSVEAAVQMLQDAYRGGAIGSRLFLGALCFIGDEAAFYHGMNLLIDQHAEFDIELLFTPIAPQLRGSPGFEAAMTRMGITDYWHQRGLPGS